MVSAKHASSNSAQVENVTYVLLTNHRNAKPEKTVELKSTLSRRHELENVIYDLYSGGNTNCFNFLYITGSCWCSKKGNSFLRMLLRDVLFLQFPYNRSVLGYCVE